VNRPEPLLVAFDDLREAARRVDRIEEATEAQVAALVTGIAQASATLAVAEEQRTANLLALAALASRTESAALLDIARDRLGLPS
jgi:hypothetical protein